MLVAEQSLSLEHAILIAAVVFLAVQAAVHAVINKRNSRSAFAWLGVIILSPLLSSSMFIIFGWAGVLVLSPLLGSLLYLLIGINHVPRKYRKAKFRQLPDNYSTARSNAENKIMTNSPKWRGIFNTGKNLNYSPQHFCQIDMLNTGDEAYPAMLAAIDQAQTSISLFSYIFSNDACGEQFVQALLRAHSRGVAIRVLVDAVGSHKSRFTLLRRLRRGGVACERFLPVLFKTQFSNMRNHRKLMVVDASIAFAGGLNIGLVYWPQQAGDKAVEDLHFKLQGPLVNYLQEVFANDWAFVCEEELKGAPWFSDDVPEQGDNLARVIVDGPSFTEERIRWHFLNAINCAEQSIRIMTPYFLPDEGLTAALCSAALRGVTVEILVPGKSDHSVMDWALSGSMFEMLARGCHFYYSGPVFDHSKLLLIDDEYASIGSANWDARSLRLNFELNIEFYGKDFAAELSALFIAKRQAAKKYSLEKLQARSALRKLRDGIARLFGPYL